MYESVINVILTSVVSACVGGGLTYLVVVGKLVARVTKLEKWKNCVIDDVTDSINESIAERKLLLKSILACLYGLKEQGCNGPVTKAVDSLETYLCDQSHKTIPNE